MYGPDPGRPDCLVEEEDRHPAVVLRGGGVLLHALTDLPAALFQYQGRQSIALIAFVEVFAFLCGIFCLLTGKKLLAAYVDPEAEHQQ